MMRRSGGYPRAQALALLVTFLAGVCPAGAWAQGAVPAQAASLDQAREHYEFAEFGRALEICNALIASGRLAGADLREAHALKARCLVNQGNNTMAQESFCDALRVDRGWRPAPYLLTRDEQEVFDRALASCTLAEAPAPAPGPTPVFPSAEPRAKADGGKSFFKNPVVLVLGGALLVGGALALAGGGGGGDDNPPAGLLPPFPPPPAGR